VNSSRPLACEPTRTTTEHATSPYPQTRTLCALFGVTIGELGNIGATLATRHTPYMLNNRYTSGNERTTLRWSHAVNSEAISASLTACASVPPPWPASGAIAFPCYPNRPWRPRLPDGPAPTAIAALCSVSTAGGRRRSCQNRGRSRLAEGVHSSEYVPPFRQAPT
jgi:hypothetical protein